MQSLEGGCKLEPSLLTEKASVTETPCVREYRLNGSLLRDVMVQGQWLTVGVLPLLN
ncbi:hypothetical protein [Burkholderia sp. Leaf177]|uniref:hypothetical protein n=1 Tax=Burkholderia sp. Leaf177 TaxID=1736287 RepID=UPI000B0D81A8|nr:hypothetical protein [Burkholderia sp. Leaf177]